MEELWRMEQEHAAASKSQAPGPAGFAFDDEEEDPFGYGGAFDAEESFGAPKTSKPAAAFDFDEEEDVFGYGGGFEDEPDRPQAPVKTPQAPSKTPDAIAKSIAENRAKALARKAAMAGAKSSSAAPFPTEDDFLGIWSKGQILRDNTGERLLWDNGRVDTIQRISHASFQLTLPKDSVTAELSVSVMAELKEDGKLHWSDGDVWSRKASEASAGGSKPDASAAAPVNAQVPANLHEGDEAANMWAGMDYEEDVFGFDGAGFDDA